MDSGQSTGTRSTDRIAARRLVSNTAVDQICPRVCVYCAYVPFYFFFLIPSLQRAIIRPSHPGQKEKKKELAVRDSFQAF